MFYCSLVRARAYLLQAGCEIIEENYRSGHREIDLIVQEEEVVVFVEVKMRSGSDFGMPEDFVDERKAEYLRMAAENWMLKNKWSGRIRFDIVAILEEGKLVEITRFRDAF